MGGDVVVIVSVAEFGVVDNEGKSTADDLAVDRDDDLAVRELLQQGRDMGTTPGAAVDIPIGQFHRLAQVVVIPQFEAADGDFLLFAFLVDHAAMMPLFWNVGKRQYPFGGDGIVDSQKGALRSVNDG